MNIAGVAVPPSSHIFPTDLAPEIPTETIWFPIFESDLNVRLSFITDDQELQILDGIDAWGFIVDLQLLAEYFESLSQHESVIHASSVDDPSNSIIHELSLTNNSNLQFDITEVYIIEYKTFGLLNSLYYKKSSYTHETEETEVLFECEFKPDTGIALTGSTQQYRVSFSNFPSIILVILFFSKLHRKNK